MQVSSVKFNELDQGVRLDAEYYKPYFLSIEKILQEVNCRPLKEVSQSIKSFGAYALCNQMNLVDKGIPYIRCKDIKESFVNFSDILYIDEATNMLLSKSSISPHIVMLTMSGTVGNSAVADPRWKYPINSNQDIAKIKTNDLVSPFYLAMFLNTKYGKNQTERLPIGSIQQHIFIWQLKNLLVFLPSQGFQNNIANLYVKAVESIKNSEESYQQAEQILLSELNLLNWKPKHRHSFVKNFSDTQSSERTDAEYFQPMYDEIEKIITKYKKGFDLIKNKFKQNKKTFKKITENNYQYIEISSINVSDGSMTPLQLKGYDLPANAKIKFFKDDIVVSKVRPYRGAIGIVNNSNYVGSGAFTVLQESGEINKETLMVFLRSKPMLSYSLKFNTGTSYPTITDDDVLNFPIPLIEQRKQKQIKSKVEKATVAKYVSREILDIAKRGVELAIEKDEKHAQKWIDLELNKQAIVQKK